jgi:hypothetical protein
VEYAPPFFHEAEGMIATLRYQNDCHREWLDTIEESQEKIDAVAQYHFNALLWEMGCVVCGTYHDQEEEWRH